ncbi:choline kinase [Diplodia corticola]|uniref:Choline kinase n=1 Tax=Diplodia corticola TaxID=236234 RepID=A0A1J9S1W4_9PEZI|nr:choline kinase [Diplodia corticola]OJD34567.1 choline kinase [Diplodia corticola]
MTALLLNFNREIALNRSLPTSRSFAFLPALLPLANMAFFLQLRDRIARINIRPVVTIAAPQVSPTIEAHSKDMDDDGACTLERTPSKQQHRIKIGKRLSGRPLVDRNVSSSQSVAESALSEILAEDSANPGHRGHNHHIQPLVAQVSAWLKEEKARRAARKAAKREPRPEPTMPSAQEKAPSESADTAENEVRRPSDASEGSAALDALEQIIEKGLSVVGHEGRKVPHRISRKLRRQSTAGSSDTEYHDGDVLVPSCDVVLDNSRTLAYSGGGVDEVDIDDQLTPGTRKAKEKQAWATFKYEIVRLAHTLRLKGWRRVPMDRSSDIEVERLSGALTNAVYVVSPPKDLPPREGEDGDIHPRPRNPPPKLLLRIYGPQVEHLIDRESELQILRRLARKKIGPRLLGTFSNGRFEEFFHARTLTPRDLRNPETSVQIAKRMRELHEGIDLLPQERDDGPFIWKNWDKWVDRCEYISKWLDAEVLKGSETTQDIGSLAELGFVCGVPWEMFRQTVEKYRTWLKEKYGGCKHLNERLVFAHNDTQYGNILRLMPPGDSPLLLPANEHKQLIVIDFEYANANTPGLEFANHFTEWCYNYHDEKAPHAVNTNAYPTPAEQHRFIRSYVTHRPFQPSQSSDSSIASSNVRPPTLAHSSSISAFMLDSRAPPQQLEEQEEREEAELEKEIKRLMAETQIWRLANSAQWVAWGIVQAKVSGLPDFDDEMKKNTAANRNAGPSASDIKEGEQSYMTPQGDQGVGMTDPPSAEAEEAADVGDANSSSGAAEGEEEFDYLGYANDRAMFFWGDAVKLGIIKEDELPEEVRKRLKIVEY